MEKVVSGGDHSRNGFSHGIKSLTFFAQGTLHGCAGNAADFSRKFSYFVCGGIDHQGNDAAIAILIGDAGSGDNDLTKLGEEMVHFLSAFLAVFNDDTDKTDSFFHRKLKSRTP
jgi:hypothetical protein